MLSIQDKIPILPCWHIGAHPLMPTSTHQLGCSTKGPFVAHYHKGSITRTPMMQMTMINSTNMPPRVQRTMTITADPSPTICRANSVCPQCHQDLVTPSQGHPSSHPWLLPCTGYRWRTVHMSCTECEMHMAVATCSLQ